MSSRVLLALAAAGPALATGAVSDARTMASGTLVFALGDGARDTSEIVSARLETSRLTWLTRHKPSGSEPRWTADGRHIVFSTGHAIWRMTARGGQFRRLPGKCCFDVASPDARRVAVCTADGLEVWSAGGRRLRMLSRGRCGTQPAWAPNGRYLAGAVSARGFGEYARTFVFRTVGRRRAWPLTRRRADMQPVLIAWAPDSRRLLIAGTRNFFSSTSNVDVVSYDGKGRQRVVRGLGFRPSAAWSADGRSIAFVGRAGGVYVLPSSGGVPRRIAATRSAVFLDWSPRSDTVAFSDRRGISIVPASGGRVRRLTRRGMRAPLDWSPRGSTIVFNFNERNDIGLVDVRSGRVRQLASRLWDGYPSLAGSRIAFVRARGAFGGGRSSVYVMRRDGSALRRLGRGHLPRLSRDGRYLVYVRAGRIIVADLVRRTQSAIMLGTTPIWSPDGQRLAFMRYEFDDDVVTSSVLWVVRRDGSEPRAVFRTAPLFGPEWSPDGRTIAAASIRGLVLIDAATGAARVIDINVQAFAWSPDSRGVAVLTPDGLEIFDSETGASRTVVAGDQGTCLLDSVAWSPDMSLLAYADCVVGAEGCDVRVVRTDGTAVRHIALHGACARDLQWQP